MAKKSTFNNPDSQEREYTRLLLQYAKFLERNVNALLIPQVDNIVAEYKAQARTDAWTDTLDSILAELIRLAAAGGATVVTKLPGLFTAVSKFNEGQFKMVVKANTGLDLPPVMPGAPASSLLGVNPFRSEPFLVPLAEGWVAENTSLIKSLPTRLHPEIEGIVRRGVMNGVSVKELQSQIKERYGVTDYRARLIAQDQTLKLNADLTRYRLLSVGVEEYDWDTVGDNRVRPEHADLNGKRFRFDKPPSVGNPGTPVRCRCRAKAVWPGDDENEVEAPPPEKKELPLGEWGKEADYIKTQGKVYKQSSEHFASEPEQARAVREYQRIGKNSYKVLNDGLNGKSPLNDSAAEAVRLLDKATSVSNLTETLYRGSDKLGDISLPNNLEAAKKLLGMVGVEKGFVSTSISPRSGFLRSVAIEINGPKKGVHVFGARDSQLVKKTVASGKLLGEGSEVLLARNTSYRIIGVEERVNPVVDNQTILVYRVETL